MSFSSLFTLDIADMLIRLRSRSAAEPFVKEQDSVRFNNFFYQGRRKPDISIDIKVVEALPEIDGAETLFVTYHFMDQQENWRLLAKGKKFIYLCRIEAKKQLMLVNGRFDKVEAYVLPVVEYTLSEDGERRSITKPIWRIPDIVYDFLQVLLINYFAQRNQGIFTHAMGVRDGDGNGLLFAGKSGNGKTTLARIWQKHPRAMVLNDDRVIVRRREGGFFIHGSPWHGDFNDYLESRLESAPLRRLFFIHHARRNTARILSPKEAFGLLYPVLFPTFWDKECLENIASFCQDLIERVPCYSLGFVDDEKVMEFVRKI
jgi:hypothetical protein